MYPKANIPISYELCLLKRKHFPQTCVSLDFSKNYLKMQKEKNKNFLFVFTCQCQIEDSVYFKHNDSKATQSILQ